MKVFKVKIGDKQFIVKAQDKVDAVKKLKDAQNKKLCDETLEEKERKAQEWVDYDIRHYGKVSETTKEDIRKMGLDFDKWDNQVNDSAIKDMRTVLASKLKKGDVILDNKNKPYKITSIDFEDGYVSLYADNLTEIGNARFTFDNDEKVKVKDSAIKDDWSKGISVTVSVGTESLIQAARNKKVIIGNGDTPEKFIGKTSLNFRLPNGDDNAYLNMQNNNSVVKYNLYDDDFTYKEFGGKADFTKAKLTAGMKKLQEYVVNQLKSAGIKVFQSKVEIGGSSKFNSVWRQAQEYNDSAIKDSNFDTVKNVFNKYGVDIIKVVNRQDGSKAIYFDKKDKDIYNKPEIMDLYRSGKLRYAGSGYFVEVLDSSAIKDATPITVESVVYKEGDTVVLEYTYNGRKMWIVTSNYKGEKTYNGGGTIEFTKEAAIQTAKDFALIHRLQKKYGTTEGNKRYLAGYKDENPFEKGQAYYYAKTGNKVDINGEVFIINEDAGKIGYTNVIGLTNVKTGKHTQISKQDFIKEARLLKDSRLLKDARPDEDTISRIKKAADNFRSNNITVAVRTDVDKDGVFIEEMYISTSGKWLETPQEADAYLRDLSNAVKFLKENYKYLGK